MMSTYRPLLVNISSVLQQVHHAVIVALSSSPDQWGGAILKVQKVKNAGLKLNMLVFTYNTFNNKIIKFIFPV